MSALWRRYGKECMRRRYGKECMQAAALRENVSKM